MILVNKDICIEEKDLSWEFVRSGGPGGQNVNKVATAVLLKFDVLALPHAVRERLSRIAGKRMTSCGVLIIKAQRYRSQELNRQDAMNRLIDLITKACIKPKPRIKTRPSASSRIKRLESKTKVATKKVMRGTVLDKE